MSIKKKWFNIWFNILLFDKIYTSSLDTRQTYCGSNLAEILTEYCLLYHTPTEHRVRRQIVKECCYNKCSLKHLITYYCKTFSSKALEAYLNKSEMAQKNIILEDYLAPHSSPELKKNISYTYHQQRNNTGVNLMGKSSSGHHLSYKGNCRKHQGKRSSCRKHILKRYKKSQRSNKLFLNKGMLEAMKIAPGPRIGNIEDDQRPIYVLSTYQRLRKY